VILLGFSKMMENEMLEKIVQDSIGPGRVGELMSENTALVYRLINGVISLGHHIPF
jgi:hypothetical protein